MLSGHHLPAEMGNGRDGRKENQSQSHRRIIHTLTTAPSHPLATGNMDTCWNLSVGNMDKDMGERTKLVSNNLFILNEEEITLK
jgi:hypothetical protein